MPAPKKAAALVAETERELADTNRRIEELRDKREQALLADNSTALDAIELTVSRLQRTAQRQQERLRLLQAQAEDEEQAAVQKRRQALRERFAKKLAEADQAAVELQETVARMVTLFRKITGIREDARAAWPISDSHLNAAAGAIEGACLSGSAIKALLSYEFYRQSADPFLGGVPGERRQPSLPGATSPRIDQQLNPSAIKPFADALKQASAFAVDAMQNRTRSTAGLQRTGGLRRWRAQQCRATLSGIAQATSRGGCGYIGGRRASVYGNCCRAHQTVERATNRSMTWLNP